MQMIQLLSLVGFCHIALAAQVVNRGQLGPYPVTFSEHEIRTNRSDPFGLSSQPRRLMVTVYQPQLDVFVCPAENQINVPYVPAAVAAGFEQLTGGLISSEIFETFQLVNCTRAPSNTEADCSSPIVLFSHGLQGSRFLYTSSLQAVASSGYTVIAIDHTYDAIAVVFPDGTIAPTNVTTAPSFAGNQTYIDTVYGDFLTPIRIADAVSVLDAIETGQLPGLSGHAKTSKTAIFGHSLGGNTAAGAVHNDSRFISGMNIDGDFNGFVRNLTITKPFVMLGEEKVLPTWPQFYQQNLKSWKSQANINNTVHLSFSDGPIVIDLLDIRRNLTAETTAAFSGTIDSTRNREIGWKLTVEWLDFVFKGRQPTLLETANEQFPDVRVLSSR